MYNCIRIRERWRQPLASLLSRGRPVTGGDIATAIGEPENLHRGGHIAKKLCEIGLLRKAERFFGKEGSNHGIQVYEPVKQAEPVDFEEAA